jgi:hypothetical protein
MAAHCLLSQTTRLQGGREDGMKHMRDGIALWVAVVLIVYVAGIQDTITALIVVLTLASAFHDRDHVRVAARRALVQLGRSMATMIEAADSTAIDDKDQESNRNSPTN